MRRNNKKKICGISVLCLVALMLGSHGWAKEQPNIFVQLGHSRGVRSVTFSPNGKYVLSGGGDLKLWDISTGREIRTFKDHSVISVAFSPDGKYALSGDERDNTISLWDISTGREIRKFKGHSGDVNSVAFSPDGKYALSGSDDETLKLWDISTGREIRTFGGYSNSVRSVAFSPDGKYAIGSSYYTLKLFDISTGREIRTFSGYSKGVHSVAFSPDGKHVIGTGDYTLKVWDVSTGRKIRTFKGHPENVQYFAISLDKKYALSAEDANVKTVKLWDVSTEREIRTFNLDEDAIKYPFISLDKKYALSINKKDEETVKLWDISTGREIRTFKIYEDGVRSVAISPDGKHFLSGNRDNTITLWDISTGRKIRTFKGHSGVLNYANSVAFSPDGKYALSGGGDKTLKLWDVSTGREVRTLGGHHYFAHSAAFSPDGKYMLVGMYPILKLWDISTGSEIRTFKGHSGAAISVAFSPDGRYALSGDFLDNTIKLWDISTGREIRTFKGHQSARGHDPYFVAFSPDGKYALSKGSEYFSTKRRDKIIKFWDISTGREIRTFKGLTHWTTPVAFSPDGKYALSGSVDNTKALKLWDISTGREIRTLTGYSGAVTSVAFSPDGKHALSGSGDKTIKFWDISTGRVIRTFKGHSDDVSSVAFSPDGKYAIGSTSYHLIIFDISTGQRIKGYTIYDGKFKRNTIVALSPNSNFVISRSFRGTIRLLDVATGRELANMISFKDGEWILITPEGFYNSSPNGDKHLNVRIGNNVYGIDQFYGVFYRPDLVHAKIQGDPEGLLAKAAAGIDLKKVLAGGAPPRVALVSPETSKTLLKRDVQLIVELTDQGGGIGKLEWKINGITVGISDEVERGIAVKAKRGSGSTIRVLKLITLSPGKNNIQVVAYNARNEIASNPGTLILNLKDEVSRTPSLYLVTIGINRYRDKSLWLNYSIPDGKSIIAAFNECSKSIFNKVIVTEVFDEQATLPGINTVFKNMATLVETHDVLVLYLAGHGITQDGRYHFLPYDFRYRNEDSIRKSAINQDHFQKWLANIKARKILVLMDTCNSGSFTKAQVVHRGIAEKTAINKLTRATGRATIGACQIFS